MANAFPAPSGRFVGRNEYIARFKARVDHFRFFIYEGISGSGKTALVLRLAKETRSVGVTSAQYLCVWPGETISSILGRIEARFRRSAVTTEHQGDPYARLIEQLDLHKTVLVLDRFENIRSKDVAPLCRAARHREGRFRVIAACRGEPELSAGDRAAIHLERVAQLGVDEVATIAGQFEITGAALEMLLEDARRSGCVCQPLTLLYLLSVCGSDLPSADFLAKQSSRSLYAFKALMAEVGDRLDPSQRLALANLAQVGMPIGKGVAVKAFGTAIDKAIQSRLLDTIDNEVYVHHLVGQIVIGEARVTPAAAKIVAKHLQAQAKSRGEPMLLNRAAQILAFAGAREAAVDTLASGWESIRDLGFLESYLKTLASIDARGNLQPRVKLLSARARMRKGNPSWVRAEMEGLAKVHDRWTRTRAHGALVYIYSATGEHKNVIAAYEALRKGTTSPEFLVSAGTLAAAAMVRLGRIADAEKQAKSLLQKLRGKKEPEHEGELHRLLARVYAQSGRLDLAVKEGHNAAKAFESAGDLYHAATAHGFVGDLYRETGDFELAKEAFGRFHDLANHWGDRDLIQIAELADAWVSLDIGDLTHAAQKITSVECEMSAAPSRRLRRYLAAARALLEAGRGHHREAATQLTRVVDQWEGAGQRAIADILRAQLVRSLIACGELSQAEAMVNKTLHRLDAKTAAPRVATFLRESALIRLRRKDVGKAMAELAQARKLFGKGGNRREEALTLHRIAHAALDEGDIELAAARAKEALALARSIKHARAIALARELQGRIALALNEPAKATLALKEASQALRKLGDEVGTLHVSEWMLRAQIASGDLAAAIRQGPKVRTQAQKLGIDEVRVRSTALSGVAFLRREQLDAASRCFTKLGPDDAGPLTVAMMWRLGEALGAIQGDRGAAMARRGRWVAAVRGLADHRRAGAVLALEQLVLPPRDRCRMLTNEGEVVVGTEQVGLLDPDEHDLIVDVLNGKIFANGEDIEIVPEAGNFLATLLLQTLTPYERVYGDLWAREPDAKPETPLKPLIRDLKKVLRKVKGFNVETTPAGIKLTSPKTFAYLVPTFLAARDLGKRHRHMMQLLSQVGTASLQTIQTRFALTRTAARRELGELIDRGLVETVRDGRGQAFRLA